MLKRRKYSKALGLAAVALPMVVGAPALAQQTNCGSPASIGNAAHAYDRPLHMVYARNSGKAVTETGNQILNAIDDVAPKKITAIVPFLLNVETPSTYAPIINQLRSRNIIIVPGIGGDPAHDPRINNIYYKDMACAARAYTEYIRIENAQGYYNSMNSASDLQDMINYLKLIGYKHIMLNPWPRINNTTLVPFTDTELDATLYQVLLSTVNNQKGGLPDSSPNNWYPGNTTKIQQMRNYSLNAYGNADHVRILINYESAPQHQTLAAMEANSAHSTEAAMQTTLTQMSTPTYNQLAPLHWIPPFTSIYDPVALGTWPWIVSRLNSM